ncbi:MAG TPA: iron-sulfur cluster carrier protein ApbC [Gammaproteobacteria bacterium]|nr:iron-sulfur cluster carrier protein ApbC [Gammaproteobacteria bacterium]
MSNLSRAQVESAIREYIDPWLERDLLSAKCIKDIRTDDGKVHVEVVLGFPAAGYEERLAGELRRHITAIEGVDEVTITTGTRIIRHAVQKGVKPLEEVKNVIVVASGKGGVGKSTTAVNLALALQAEGAAVGLMDADIYGPSLPRMLGVAHKPESKDGKTMEPVVAHGLQTISIGYLIEEDTPMIWRGPMVNSALQQLINETRWQGLDYLIVDLPPGTGDIQLTLAQKVPVSGAIIVTTPQEIALLDARKGLKMFEKVGVPVLGVVENMSTHVCSACGHEEHIFGAGGGASMARQHGVALLGSLPLDLSIREHTDGGTPTVAADPESRLSGIYRDIARRASAQLSLRPRDFSHKFPHIVVEKQ